ncbi:protein translocase subunit [Recurvomyces mirabilis]|uniref:Mitochondrial import inner membrane translocase subunit TIM44 n=1 Tax=Recurvomyces mirabilis TaxID=574656 RepID=A0AAE0WJ83_9PEZI|nr:protein translocase subunit [Recurvomyces mirabilis]KAK5160072.1 protein translocase subunit [Recurvomyces mirabilis]
MSTSSLRSLSSRAGGGLPRNLAARPTTTATYGRTAAYRRIASDFRQYSEASLQSRQHAAPTILPPFALRSHFLPTSLPAAGASLRHISFKELRAARAKERAQETASVPQQPQEPAQAKSEPAAASKQAASEPPKQETSTSSEAEAAFASARGEAERQWAKEEARQRKEQEKEEQEEKTEGEAGEEGKDGEQAKQKKEKKEAPPPHGSKTPWQVFTETLQAEFKASKEWEESTKQLSGSITDFTQNPNVKRAASAYSKAAEVASSTTGKAFLGTAGAIGRGAAWTWQTPVVKGLRTGAAAVGSGVEKATRPVRETEAYKSVKDTIDDGASQRYGGWTEKEERKRRREELDKKLGRSAEPQEIFEEDLNAGTNVTLHKDAQWKESWKSFRDNSPLMQRFFGMGNTYRESENPLISTARGVTDRIAGFFAENETAMVIKKFREMDPSFQLEAFLTEMRTYILPEVLEAYVKGDVETLKLWLSAAQYQVYAALMAQYTTAGLQSDGQIVDIRNVDILSARILEPGEIPVFVLMARTQEVHVYRKKKSGELAAGMEDKVQQVTYAIGVTRIPEDVHNPETRGWKLIELQKSGRDYI